MVFAEVSHVIWLNTGFLGDLILGTAAVKLLHDQRPQVKQYFISTPLGCRALAGLPSITAFIPFEKKIRSLRSAAEQIKGQLVKELGPDPSGAVILQVHRSARSTLLAKMLGHRLISYRESALSWLADERVDRIMLLHEAQRVGLLLEPLGIARDQIMRARPFLATLPLASEAVWQREILGFKGRLVGIAASSQWGTKRWQKEKFARLITLLLGLDDIGIVLLGSAAEETYISEMYAEVNEHPRLWNLAGKTNFDQLRGLFPRFRLLISNDSSPIHYASAFNIPTLALFGATIPQMGFAPLATSSISVGMEDLACRPCSLHGPQVCPLGHFACMEKITVDRVFAICQQMLL